MGSSRLPGKMLLKVKSKTIIEILLDRLSNAKLVDKIIVATSLNSNNKILTSHLKDLNYDFFCGSEKDVLSRYVKLIDLFNPKVIIRVTGDCPLVDPKIVDKFIKIFQRNQYDYVSNTYPHTFPNGFDVEVISPKALLSSFKLDTSKINKEHVTHYIKKSTKFSIYNIRTKKNNFAYRVTLDKKKDFLIIKKIFKYFNYNFNIPYSQIIKVIHELIDNSSYPKVILSNKLWYKAKKIIPNGNMLLSKSPDLISPKKWPAYFSKAKGCYIWDIDNNKYIDFSYMGVGTNILGYANKEIDMKVKEAIDKSTVSSLNCPEEVYLANKLLSLHKWADKVKFARSGGEANAIAIRIARAYAKNDKIAICGYHGWHDWYLSTNIQNSNSLNNHLIKGLKIEGVPKKLKNTVFPFRYNDFDTLLKLIDQKKIGIVKMEVMRNEYPKNNFLEKVRDICNKKGIILIFDECTSGFRETFGGLHLKFKIFPDLAVFGKSLGNGYPITAVIGKEKIMNAATKTFISSTFWTERIGNVASLKTLEIMKREKSWEKISKIGTSLKTKITNLAKKNNLDIEFKGLTSLFIFNIKSIHGRDYKNVITNEMLKNKILATNAIYLSISHNPKIVNFYLKNLNQVFSLIKILEKKKIMPKKYSNKPKVLKFERLN